MYIEGCVCVMETLRGLEGLSINMLNGAEDFTGPILICFVEGSWIYGSDRVHK